MSYLLNISVPFANSGMTILQKMYHYRTPPHTSAHLHILHTPPQTSTPPYTSTLHTPPHTRYVSYVQLWHCNECGICRQGDPSHYFHCPTCAACYPLELKGRHKCRSKAMHDVCPLCLEDMFQSVNPVVVLENCGHTIHQVSLRILKVSLYIHA